MASIIVAFDENYLIGRGDGRLPWHISDDLKLFKNRTLNHPIICGRKTWESLPIRPLPGRLNIVVSTTLAHMGYRKQCENGWKDGVVLVDNIDDAIWAIARYPEYQDKEVFIIGGGQLYETALDAGVVDKLYVSRIRGTHEGNIFFPELGKEWKWTLIESHTEFDVFEVTKPADASEVATVASSPAQL